MKTALRLVSLSLALACAAGAASWVDLSRDAPLQIVGRCQSRASHWEGGAIVSDSEVAVLNTVRGPAADTVTIRQQGGEVDGIGQKVAGGQKLLAPGATYLLFLVPGDGGRWQPIPTGVNPVVDRPEAGPSVAGTPLDEVLAALGGAN